MQTKEIALSFMVVALSACRSEPQTQPEPVHVEKTAASALTPPPGPSGVGESGDTRVDVAGLASCQPTAEASSLVSRAVGLADANEDGQVTRAEARSALNLVLGGAFFRADRDGDGKITPEEGREARRELQQRFPMLADLLAQTRRSTGVTPFKLLADLVDVRYGKTLSLADARGAADKVLDDLYRVADTNQDGIIGRSEAVQAIGASAQKLGKDAFARADANHDKGLSEAEFKDTMSGAAKTLFDLADADHDGKLTEAEAAAASNAAGLRLGMPSMPSATQ